MKTMISRYGEYPKEIPGISTEDLRNELIRKYAPMVKYFAERFAARVPPNISIDELTSAGMVGLFNALGNFDPEKGFKFETYAACRIKGAILDELRKMDWVPRSVRREAQEIEEAFLSLQVKLDREPDDAEVAQALGVDLENYYKMLQRTQGVRLISLDEIKSSSAGSLFDSIESDQSSPLDEVKKKELKSVISEVLSMLPEKEQLVLTLYYYEELTLKEIGSVMDLTESRISQIHSKVIISLRSKLKRYYES